MGTIIIVPSNSPARLAQSEGTMRKLSSLDSDLTDFGTAELFVSQAHITQNGNNNNSSIEQSGEAGAIGGNYAEIIQSGFRSDRFRHCGTFRESGTYYPKWEQ